MSLYSDRSGDQLCCGLHNSVDTKRCSVVPGNPAIRLEGHNGGLSCNQKDTGLYTLITVMK